DDGAGGHGAAGEGAGRGAQARRCPGARRLLRRARRLRAAASGPRRRRRVGGLARRRDPGAPRFTDGDLLVARRLRPPGRAVRASLVPAIGAGARAEAEGRAVAARALRAGAGLGAAAPTAPVEAVWFVHPDAAPARLPNGERGPLRWRDGVVGPLAAPPG